MIKKCVGCGCKLQSDNPEKLGYIPGKKIKEANLCERCFKIIHYNDAKVVTLPVEEKAIITTVNKSKNYVLFLVDFLNISEKTLQVYKKIIRPKTLIISKSDIIPFSIKQNKIIKWLEDYYEINNDILFISSLKNKNINLLINYLEHKEIKKCYLLGFTNTGKSSLVNAISKMQDLNNNSITTSLVPNTTLDFLNIKINERTTIIDSPGFSLKNNIYDINNINFIRKINPKKFIKPIIYQLKANTAIIIDDIVRVDNLEKSNNYTFYLSNKLKLTKVYNNNKLTNLNYKELNINDNSDLVIVGLGFIHIKHKCKLRVYIDNLDLLEVRKSFF